MGFPLLIGRLPGDGLEVRRTAKGTRWVSWTLGFPLLIGPMRPMRPITSRRCVAEVGGRFVTGGLTSSACHGTCLIPEAAGAASAGLSSGNLGPCSHV